MYTPYPSPRATQAVRTALVSKVFGLLSFSFAFTVVGGIVGMAAPGLSLFAALGAMGMVFALGYAREKTGLNLALLYGMTFLMGMGVGPIIGMYAAVAPGVLGNALVITGGLVGGLSLYSWRSERDLTQLQNILFPALIGLVLMSIVGIFLRMPAFQLMLSLGAAVIFSGLMLVDVQRLRDAQDDSMPTAIMMTVGLYLNIINIFMSILQILGFVSRDD